MSSTVRILAYTYDANVHCPGCAFGALYDRSKFRRSLTCGAFDYIKDEHGLPYTTKDREGNAITPVFSHMEWPEPVTACGTCGVGLPLAA